MVRIGQFDKLGTQNFDLPVVEDAHAGQIAILVVEIDLFLRQPKAIPLSRRLRQLK